MRLSPLYLAISLTLLAGCSQHGSREEFAVAEPAEAAEASPAIADASAAADTAAAQAAASVAASAPGPHPARIAMRAAELRERHAAASTARQFESVAPKSMAHWPSPPPPPAPGLHIAASQAIEANTENYASFEDNPLHLAQEEPVSTFSIDVDTGSYSNVRRMLVAGERPPADAVRAEEMLNYFDHGYPAPADRAVPFRVSTEIAPAPWNGKHHLLQVGIQGYRVPAAEIPAANIVFLVDTSGSMESPDKLPLLKRSFSALTAQLRPQDRVSVVAYAGSAGLVLPPTSGRDRQAILDSLERLSAGGSTNGGQGLQLAYATARQAFIPNGVNRVVLATDGDFNVGTVDQKALETMVGDQRKSGIALTTLGFGAGNYNDAMAERLADLGNGNHAYIDNENEARKVLVEELSSTMLTIAQDVKIQLEFNPAVVAEYRLIGYENRALRREDFNNDQVDAGEIGAGHDVTALYEVTLVGAGGASVDPLRYGPRTALAGRADELGWLRLRYKQPGGETSRLIESPLLRSQLATSASPRLRWSAAVAAYADLLRGGKHMGGFDWRQVRSLAAGAMVDDRWGHRAEFLELVDRARSVTTGGQPVAIGE